MNKISRKILSFGITLCILLSVFSGVVFAKDTETIVILYENDVHCAVAGYSKLAAMKNELSEDYEYVGVVSSGDFVQGGTLGAVSRGEYIVSLMNLVGYDAVTLGNHEFDYKLPRLNELSSMMNTKPISCNFQEIGESKSYFEPYSIVSYGDVDIAYIGITTPSTLSSSSPAQFKDENGEYIYTFNVDTLYDVVQASIDSAKAEGADFIIALSHIGYEEDPQYEDARDLIENTDGFDVVLDAHSHSVIENMKIDDEGGNEVILTSTGTKFENIGKLTISGDEITTELIETESYTNTDATVDAELAEINEEYSALGNRKIGESEIELITHDADGNRLVRTTETNLGNLCSDAFRIVTGADIGYVNGGGIRAPIEVGDVTFNDVLNVFPYNNSVVVAEVSGQVIKDFLELAVKYWPSESGAFPHVSGLTFSVNTAIESAAQVDNNWVFTGIDGEYRVYDIMVLNKDSGEYEPIDLTKNYSIASDSYHLLECGDGMSMFADATILQNDGMLDVDLFETYITENLDGVIGEEYAEVDNRITFVVDIANEPSYENGYTVGLNGNCNEKYQWYEVNEVAYSMPEDEDESAEQIFVLMDKNLSEDAYALSEEESNNAIVFFEAGTFKIVPSDDLENVQFNLYECDFVEFAPSGEALLPIAENTWKIGRNTIYFVVPSSENSITQMPEIKFEYDTFAIRNAVPGATSKTLTGAENGKYYMCRITGEGGVVLDSEVVKYRKKTSSGGSGSTRYTVKFDTNGGSVITNKTVTRNSKLAEPQAPTRDGFDFIGWFTDKEMTDAYDFESKVTKSFTIYAKWEKHDDEIVTAEWKNPFTDIKENDWFYNDIKFVSENGLMKGVTDTTFAPNENLTRAMLVTMLYRAENEPATNRSIPFSDVDMGAYYASAVSWAKQNGIVNGVTENEFAPDESITREQIAAIMMRYAVYKGMDAVTIEENLHFADADEISEYAMSSMNWAVGAGLINGKSESTLKPKDNATRAEVAAILYRFIASELMELGS